MKKQKLKNLLKFGILLFGIPLLLINCQDDGDILSNERKIEQSKFQIKTIDYKQLKKENVINKILKQ